MADQNPHVAQRRPHVAKRHPRDLLSLLTGLLLVSGSVLFLVGDSSGSHVDLRWVAPVVLVGIGLIGLAASLRGTTTTGPEGPRQDP